MDNYSRRMTVLTTVVELRKEYHQLQEELSRSGQFPDHARENCNSEMEKVFYDLARFALQIQCPILSSSSSSAEFSLDESMASASSSEQNMAPPVLLPGNRTSSDKDATSSTNTQLPLQPQSPGLRTNNLTYPRVNSCRRKPSLGLRKRFPTAGSIGINKLRSANRMKISDKLRRSTRATRNTTPQYQQFVVESSEDTSEILTSEFADKASLSEFNDAILANDLSGQDWAHAALYKIIEQTLDPVQWRMKPNTEAVRKLLADNQVKTRIKDFILEHLEFGFHIDRSPECVTKFLDDMAKSILPEDDNLRNSLIRYFANCAVKPSTNFGFTIKLMLKLHQKYCSNECVQSGNLYSSSRGWKKE